MNSDSAGKLKLSFIIGDINGHGGTERVTLSVIAMLCTDYEIHLISLHSCELKSSYEIPEGVTVHHLEISRGAFFLYHWLRGILKLRALLKQIKAQIMINSDSIISAFSVPACKGLPGRLLSWEHFHFKEDLGNRKRQLTRKYFLPRGDGIITLTEADLQQTKSALPEQVVYHLPNPLAPQLLEKPITNEARKKICLAVGRLAPQKGFDLLIPMWSKIIQQIDSEWQLHIIGNGEQLEELKQLINKLKLESSISTLPFSENIASRYQQAEILLFPSRFEGFGLVLCEARHFGLACVSFDCEHGPADIICDKQDGYLVKAGDQPTFIQRSCELINNEELRQGFQQAAANDQRFYPDSIREKWCEMLTEQIAISEKIIK